MTQIPLIDDGHAARLEREREYELDRTPGPVCHQGIEWGIERTLVEIGEVAPTMIDIGAGSGVFGQQLRRIIATRTRDLGEIWDQRSIAIEPRLEEIPHLRRHNDVVEPRTFGSWLKSVSGRPYRHAWVASNPAFSIFPDIVRTCVPICAAVLLYGSIAWGCSEAGAELFEQHRPYACARVVGRVHHRGPGNNPKTGEPWGADQRDNCWWLWLRDHAPKRWSTENLPLLSSEQRRWTIPPGQEP